MQDKKGQVPYIIGATVILAIVGSLVFVFIDKEGHADAVLSPGEAVGGRADLMPNASQTWRNSR